MIGGLSKLFITFLYFKNFEKTTLCAEILASKSHILRSIFACFSALAENTLNFAFYWVYYWRVKHELKLFGADVVNPSEAYTSMRSIRIPDVNSGTRLNN